MIETRKCLRCNHEWALRKPAYGEPLTCPKCGSPAWNKVLIKKTPNIGKDK